MDLEKSLSTDILSLSTDIQYTAKILNTTPRKLQKIIKSKNFEDLMILWCRMLMYKRSIEK